ncbi:MAG: vWA domain-containing protein [Bacteroidota bacterium]
MAQAQIVFPTWPSGTPAFTDFSESDGLGGTKTGKEITIFKGTVSVTFDFNFSGGSGTESWVVNTPSCTSGMCPTLSPISSTGVLTFTPLNVSTLEFGLEGNVGSSSQTILVRIKIVDGPNAPRQPIDLVLVLDQSGSMSSYTISPTTRWDALKTAVLSFMTKFENFAVIGDRVAITYFDTPVVNGLGTAIAPFTPIVPGVKATVATSLSGHGPADLTAMGEGLLDAKAKHALLTTSTNRKVVLLFTDGYQNEGRLVTPGGTTVDDGTSINNSSGSIKIYTVGIGAAGSLPAILASIANNNHGTLNSPATISSGNASWSTLTGNDAVFVTDFDNAFKQMLEGSSPQIVGMTEGTIQFPSNTIDSATFVVNKDVDKLLFELYASPAAQVRIYKNGIAVTPTRTDSGPGYRTFIFDFPRSGVAAQPDGTWTVITSLPGSGGTATHGNVVRFQYSLIAMVDDHRFDYTCSQGATSFKSGDDLKPTVNIHYNGTEVTNATVQAVLLKPGQDLGNLLATTKVTLGTPPATDPGSAGNQKYDQLLSDPAFLAKMLPINQSMTLTHTSGGVYTATPLKLDTTGVHRIIYFINETLPGGDIIQRREEQTFYVQFKDIDLPASNPILSGSGTSWTLTLRPVTLLHKFVGPAFQQTFTVTSPGLVLNDLVDVGDGTYKLNMTGSPDDNVKIALLDVPVYTGTLSEIQCYDPNASFWTKLECWLLSLGIPLWLASLIVVIIILILVWLLRRRR